MEVNVRSLKRKKARQEGAHRIFHAQLRLTILERMMQRNFRKGFWLKKKALTKTRLRKGSLE